MPDFHTKLQIQNFEILIALEQSSYLNALHKNAKAAVLKQIRKNIRTLKVDLQKLLDKTSDE